MLNPATNSFLTSPSVSRQGQVASGHAAGDGTVTGSISGQSAMIPAIALTDVLAPELLLYIMQFTEAPLVLSTTCWLFQKIYQEYTEPERQNHAFTYTLTYNMSTPASRENFYNKLIDIGSSIKAIASSDTVNGEALTDTTSNKIAVPDPDTAAWRALKDQPLAINLTGEARRSAWIKKTYITVWSLLLQPEVIENRPQASELMRLLLDLLPYISNAQGYAKKLFSTGFPQETLTQLVDIHLDRGLQLVIKHFPISRNSPICQFIVAQLPPALEIQGYLVSALEKGEIESFLFYAVKNFYRFDPKSTPRSLIIHKQFNALLNTLFAKGCDIEKYNSRGQTVLSYALGCIYWEEDGDWQKDRLCELVEILINAGANCNQVTNEDNTFLMMACRYKKPELVSLLIHQPQIAVNAKNIFDLTALSFAVDDLPVLQALLPHPEIDVNIKNHDGESLLYDAVRENKLETVQALRARHPRFDDLNKRDMKGKSLLDYVMKKNNLPLLEVLLQYAKIDVNKINARGGYNPLHYAVEKRNLPLMQRLLQHPTIDVNAKDKDGNSVLEYVLESRHLPLIENFFTSTIDPDARLFIFNTLILRGQSKVCIGLLQTMDESQHKTFINQALARARQENRLSVASILIKTFGADPKAIDDTDSPS